MNIGFNWQNAQSWACSKWRWLTSYLDDLGCKMHGMSTRIPKPPRTWFRQRQFLPANRIYTSRGGNSIVRHTGVHALVSTSVVYNWKRNKDRISSKWRLNRVPFTPGLNWKTIVIRVALSWKFDFLQWRWSIRWFELFTEVKRWNMKAVLGGIYTTWLGEINGSADFDDKLVEQGFQPVKRTRLWLP